jgi:hypothetical protein
MLGLCATLAAGALAAIGPVAQDRLPAPLGAAQRESPLIQRALDAARSDVPVAERSIRGFASRLGAGKAEPTSSDEEIRLGISRITGLVPPADLLQQARRTDAESRRLSARLGMMAPRLGGPIPRRFSWRARQPSIVTPSRDQGQSNACWAFASIGAFESAYAKANPPQGGRLDTFSEQAVINCSGAGTASGGGWWAFAYLRDYGATPYDEVPYTGRDPRTPPANCRQRTDFRAINLNYVEPNDAYFPKRELIKQMILQHGPVAAGVFATDRFMSHMDGSVFRERFGPGGRGYDRSIGANHAIVLIGWNDDLGAWIVKNSYGPDNWGVRGFGYVAYETNNIGFGAAWVDAVNRNRIGAQLGAVREVIPAAGDDEDLPLDRVEPSSDDNPETPPYLDGEAPDAGTPREPANPAGQAAPQPDAANPPPSTKPAATPANDQPAPSTPNLPPAAPAEGDRTLTPPPEPLTRGRPAPPANPGQAPR